jgi:alpha-beta hydrolase superfamily lysophospholipase
VRRFSKDIEEYFEEISIVIRQINDLSRACYLLGHSTGGLTASSYMNTGAERNRINALIKFAFLDFYQSGFESSSAIGVRKLFP